MLFPIIAKAKLFSINTSLKQNRGKFYNKLQMTADENSESEKPKIPGKIILSKEIIVERETKMKALSEKWKKERISKEDLDKQTFGFTKNSEILNGRAAMFFIVTGLLTEIWTGQTIPGQIETMIRTFGLI